MKKCRFFYTKLFLSLLVIFIISFIAYMQKRNVNLAYMTDAKYLPYVMVSLDSVMRNKRPSTNYHVHIIAEDFSEADNNQIKKMMQKGLKISIYPAKEKKLDISHLGRFASYKIALQKLFIADYLPDTNKVLYLDADTLVQTDLSDIYHLDIKEQYAGATKDGLMYQYPEHINGLNLRRHFYFNSGIMLLNLEKIRQDKLSNQALIYLNTHQDIFGDQDILNVIFKDKVHLLSYRYNCNSTFFEEKDAAFLSKFYGEPVPDTPQKVYESAYILHFAGHKPWTDWFTHPYLKKLWLSYAAETKAKYNITY